MKKLTTLTLALMMVLALVLTSCGGGGSSTAPPASAGSAGGGSQPADSGDDTPDPADTGGTINKKDHIVYAVHGNIATLDPQYGVAQWEWAPNMCIYDSLFYAPEWYANGDYENVIPWLCESYEVSDDNLDWTFHIRQGVKFHDGSELTADDVIFSLDRSKTSPYTAPGLRSANSFEKVDDYTVIMRQDYPFPTVRQVLADGQWGIANKNAIETYGQGSREAVIGTGPYKLVDWDDNNNITMEYFEDYWAPEPDIKSVTFRPAPDYNAMAIAVNSGEIDVTYFGNISDLNGFIENPDLQCEVWYRSHTQGITMNNQQPPFDDLRVRRAINHAIDKDAVNQIVYEGTYNTDILVKTPPNCEGYAKALEEGRLMGYEYDPEKAKELLAEVGYNEDNPLMCSMITTTSNIATGMAQATQDMLAKVNIIVDVQPMESAAWVETVAQAKHELSFNDTGVGPYYTPMGYWFMYATGLFYNRENTNNEVINRLSTEGLGTWDKAEREEMYAAMLQEVSEQAISVPIVQIRGVTVSPKGLKTYPDPMLGYVRVYDMKWVEE